MGCFLGCFGGAKESKTRKQRVNRGSPQRQINQTKFLKQRNRVRKVQQEVAINVEQSIEEKPKNDLVSELLNKAEEEKQELSQSPRKRVTFNSNVTTYEHVPVRESVDSLPDGTIKDEHEVSKLPGQSHSVSEDSSNSSVASSVASYPPNHRYHNARYSDDEAEEYGDSDLDDDDEFAEDEFDDDEYGEDALSESVLTESMESKTGDSVLQTIDGDIGSKNNPRDRSDYINSVLNPVENLTQWKAAKTRGRRLYQQKENLTSNTEAPPRLSLEPTFKSKPDQTKSSDQEISVDASLLNWLASSETTPSKRSGGGFETVTSKETMSGGFNYSNSAKSFEDRPILGALTVEELRQISASNSPKKSPSRSPDEMPIIGTVGTYWNHSGSEKKKDSDLTASFKGIPNTTSKYREDKTVNWHSTPFETRLNRALDQRI